MEIGLVRRIDIDNEMQQSYLDYAMSVIVARALPDARDGLKPVHRRILYAMYAMGLHSEAAFKKSARIVGEVLGKLHPHGDMAVYDAMARMAQDFSMRYALVEGQGNFGSVDGDPPAAMRYTEARMSAMASDMLADIEKDTVDFTANFDGTLDEPVVLPASIPNLLINGATGIAVGMATSIPPHNLGEVCDALIFMLTNWSKSEQISLDDLMQFIHGPDFPTGGILLHRKGKEDALRTAYATGRSRLTLQARSHIEEMSHGRSRIIVTELPFQTNKSTLLQRVADLVREGKLEGITDLRDESDRQGMRIVIEISKSADAEKVLAALYDRTPMQSTFSVILLALVDGEPRLLNLKTALRVYLDHRLHVARRRSQFELQQAKQRAHILEGLRIALQNLDEVIQIIRNAKDADQARMRLRRRFKLSEMQAQSILDMRLRRIASLERRKIDLEHKEALQNIKRLEALLRSPAKMRAAIAEELTEIKARYGDRRRTQIFTAKPGKRATPLLTAADLVPDTPTWVVVTEDGLLSSTPTARAPRISGRKPPLLVIGANTRDTLYLINSEGVAAAIPVHTIPTCDDPKDGTPIRSATPLPEGVPLSGGIALPAERGPAAMPSGHLLTITKRGLLKKSPLEALPGPSAKTFQVMNVSSQDAIAWVRYTTRADDVILVSSAGFAIRFSEEDVRPMGLAASGVMGMRLDEPAVQIVGGDIVAPHATLLVLCQDGRAKRVPLNQFPRQGRYGKGVLTWKSDDPARLVGAAIGMANDRATVTIARAADRSLRFGDVPKSGRTSAGRSVIPLKQGDRVTGLRPLLPRPALSVEKKSPKKNAAKGASSAGRFPSRKRKGKKG
jgi:DNA gyrase subunit A